MTTIFDQALPGGVPHSLIFGYKQDSFLGSDSGDGVIKLSSQLRSEAQEQASLVRGFDEDHTSILVNKSVSALLNQILDANSE